MLAQNFKTAADLGIKDAEIEALIKVLGMLERGELRHVPEYDEPDVKNGFNMSDYNSDCGTVCCLAGWGDRLFGTDFVARHGFDLPNSLDALFYAPGKSWTVTTAQAAIALRSYLSTGEANWAEALAESPAKSTRR